MNIVFLGSSHFAEPSLKALIANKHKVSCVVTQPDRQKGRGLHLGATAIKNAALENKLRLYQPQRINTPEAVKFLKEIKADLFIVISYGQILSQEILDIPKVMSINAHASLLPKYRGAAPINWAIIKGEKTTGVTIMKVTRRMDSGPIIMQKETDITDSDTTIMLEKKLSELSAHLLLDSVTSIKTGTYKLTEQDEARVSFAPKLKKEDGMIEWGKSAFDIYNLVRGSLPWPGAFTYYKGKLLKIYKTDIKEVSECQGVRVSGEILEVSRKGITVACAKESLMINELQLEGRRIMTAEEFIAGHKISVGERLGE